eukprot:scaffold1808_cov360-Prasinococcus_capsulatus_cf.AAC.25
MRVGSGVLGAIALTQGGGGQLRGERAHEQLEEAEQRQHVPLPQRGQLVRAGRAQNQARRQQQEDELGEVDRRLLQGAPHGRQRAARPEESGARSREPDGSQTDLGEEALPIEQQPDGADEQQLPHAAARGGQGGAEHHASRPMGPLPRPLQRLLLASAQATPRAGVDAAATSGPAASGAAAGAAAGAARKPWALSLPLDAVLLLLLPLLLLLRPTRGASRTPPPPAPTDCAHAAWAGGAYIHAYKQTARPAPASAGLPACCIAIIIVTPCPGMRSASATRRPRAARRSLSRGHPDPAHQPRARCAQSERVPAVPARCKGPRAHEECAEPVARLCAHVAINQPSNRPSHPSICPSIHPSIQRVHRGLTVRCGMAGATILPARPPREARARAPSSSLAAIGARAADPRASPRCAPRAGRAGLQLARLGAARYKAGTRLLGRRRSSTGSGCWRPALLSGATTTTTRSARQARDRSCPR